MYKNAFVVNKALVLIVGIAKFGKEEQSDRNLPGVENSVKYLKELWQNKYKYDVYICNEKTLRCSKWDVINFIDEHTIKLHDTTYNYNAVIVHILTHGNNDAFDTSDSKTMQMAFFPHELSSAADFGGNKSLIKVIFYHVCRGQANYSIGQTQNINSNSIGNAKSNNICQCSCFGTKTNAKLGGYHKYHVSPSQNEITQNNQSITRGSNTYSGFSAITDGNIDDSDHGSADSNLYIVYGNIEGRVMSDTGNFTKCICEEFEDNMNKFRIRKKDVRSLVVEIGRKLQQITNNAEICATSETLRYHRILFEKSKQKKNDGENKHSVIEMQKKASNTNLNKKYSKLSIQSDI